MSLITNKKVITTKDQNDLQPLHDFVTSLFERHNTGLKKKLKPDNFLEEGSSYVYYRIPDGMSVEMILNEGCELAALDGNEIIELPGTILTVYKHVFTPQQHEENADALAKALREIREFKALQVEANAGWNAKIKESEGKVQKLANWVETRYDSREENCVVLLDYTSKQRHYKSVVTKQIVKDEDFQPED